MFQLDIMGTEKKNIQQDAKNKHGFPPSDMCYLDFG